jgi:large subunit ribosomal protein L6
MSRIANAPVAIPSGVEVNLNGSALSVKGSNGAMDFNINELVNASVEDGSLLFKAKKDDRSSVAMAGTMRALVNNMVTGVSKGFEKKLELVGVGYRAQVQGKKLNLTLGFSHPVIYDIPEGITIETPSQTEILVKGADKQKVGQVSAEIRAWRPPEPYKGKGVRYADEHIVRKDAKKK